MLLACCAPNALLGSLSRLQVNTHFAMPCLSGRIPFARTMYSSSRP
jgi:hypothetical protein